MLEMDSPPDVGDASFSAVSKVQQGSWYAIPTHRMIKSLFKSNRRFLIVFVHLLPLSSYESLGIVSNHTVCHALTMQGATNSNRSESAPGRLKICRPWLRHDPADRPYYRQERGQEVPLTLPVTFADSCKET